MKKISQPTVKRGQKRERGPFDFWIGYTGEKKKGKRR